VFHPFLSSRSCPSFKVVSGFQLASSPYDSGLYNFPFQAPIPNVGPKFFLLTTGNNAVAIAEEIVTVYELGDYIETEIEVTKIEWTGNSGDYPVQITLMKARKARFVPSRYWSRRASESRWSVLVLCTLLLFHKTG
jgi:hypothetical protein